LNLPDKGDRKVAFSFARGSATENASAAADAGDAGWRIYTRAKGIRRMLRRPA
jgi:hypothetical protein